MRCGRSASTSRKLKRGQAMRLTRTSGTIVRSDAALTRCHQGLTVPSKDLWPWVIRVKNGFFRDAPPQDLTHQPVRGKVVAAAKRDTAVAVPLHLGPDSSLWWRPQYGPFRLYMPRQRLFFGRAMAQSAMAQS